MTDDKFLTREDIAVGRIVMARNLVTREQIRECTSNMAERARTGEAAASLARLLAEKGLLSGQMAEEIAEEARTKTRITRGSARLERVTADDDRAAQKMSPVKEARIRKIISKIAPGLIYLEMLDQVMKQKNPLVDLGELPRSIKRSKRVVRKALDRWVAAGVLHPVGDYPYGFSPSKRRKKEIRELLEAWQDEGLHAQIMRLVVMYE